MPQKKGIEPLFPLYHSAVVDFVLGVVRPGGFRLRHALFVVDLDCSVCCGSFTILVATLHCVCQRSVCRAFLFLFPEIFNS